IARSRSHELESRLITTPLSSSPANSPLLLEKERICALSSRSVAAPACRPIGPAATEASAPSVNLSDSKMFSASLFINSMTKSVDCAPICNPKLPPPKLKKAGAAPAVRCAATGHAASAYNESGFENRLTFHSCPLVKFVSQLACLQCVAL